MKSRQNRTGRGELRRSLAADENRIMLLSAIGRAECDELGIFGAFQRNRCTHHQLERLRGAVLKARDIGHGDFADTFFQHQGFAHAPGHLEQQCRRQEAGKLGQTHGRGGKGRNGTARGFERTFKRMIEIGRRIGDGADVRSARLTFERNAHHIGRIKTDFQGRGAGMGENQGRRAVAPDKVLQGAIINGLRRHD